jgi:hypothetical protein
VENPIPCQSGNPKRKTPPLEYHIRVVFLWIARKKNVNHLPFHRVQKGKESSLIRIKTSEEAVLFLFSLLFWISR